MNKKRLKNILPNLLMIVIIIVAFYIYRKYDYNYFSKGILEKGRTEFSRVFPGRAAGAIHEGQAHFGGECGPPGIPEAGERPGYRPGACEEVRRGAV